MINTSEPNMLAVEKEDTSSLNGGITEPYDPTDVSISSKLMSLFLLFSRLKHGEIDMETSFQRKAGLWNKTQQSRLIESILIRFPLPTFYFDGSNENKWQIVDGLQRLTTFKNFIIDKSLELENLEYLPQLNGSNYDTLPRDLQRRIRETEVPVYIINPGTPDMVKYSVFKRINTGGLILTPQEIRHAVNQGIPANFVKELASLQVFKDATCNAISPDRMDDRDFVTRFVAFYTKPLEAYKTELDKFLNLAMSDLKKLTENERGQIKSRFVKSMEIAIAIFENDAFRKRFKKEDGRKPLNKALFETWSVCLAKLPDNQNVKLINAKNIVKELFMTALNEDERFLKSISSATGDIRNIKKRFETINKIIQQSIQ